MKIEHEDLVKIESKGNTKENKIEKEKSLAIRESNVLIQKNAIALSMKEKKLLLYCISKIKPTDTPMKKYRINARDFYLACGAKGVNGAEYEEFREIARKLDREQFIIRDEKGTLYYCHWITNTKYFPKSGTIEFTFQESIAGFLFNLNKFFTQYDFRNIGEMKTKYGIDLYRLLRSYKNIRVKEIELEELKGLIGAEKAGYKKYGVFKQKVLVPAVNEINRNTDIKVDYIEVKKGNKNKVESIKFIISDNTEARYIEWMNKFEEERRTENEAEI